MELQQEVTPDTEPSSSSSPAVGTGCNRVVMVDSSSSSHSSPLMAADRAQDLTVEQLVVHLMVDLLSHPVAMVAHPDQDQDRDTGAHHPAHRVTDQWVVDLVTPALHHGEDQKVDVVEGSRRWPLTKR